MHFIGAAVQRAASTRWLADLRDPLVANQHRRADTAAARARQAANEQVARLVARRADAVSCVSEAIADEVRGLEPRGPVRVIANGCDFDDFEGLEYTPGERFRITHAGSFFGRRDPRPFLQAFKDSGLDGIARFVGDFRSTDREWAESLGLEERLSSSRTHPARSRFGSSATPRRSSCSSPTPTDGERASCRARCSSTWPPVARSSRSSLPTAPPRSSCARPAPGWSSRLTTSTG